MALAASMRDKTSKKSYILAIAGAFFFICSDSLLSQGMFVPRFNSKTVRLLIMITYYVAEELIFIATLDHFEYSKTTGKANNNTKPKNVKQEWEEIGGTENIVVQQHDKIRSFASM